MLMLHSVAGHIGIVEARNQKMKHADAMTEV